MRTLPPLLLLLSLSIIAGCDSARSATRTPEHVDSIVPREIALERFRAALAPVTSLSGGAGSRDKLVAQVIHGIEKRDTAELAALALSREEFAFLYYETNPQSLPPYDLSPGLMWFLNVGASEKGLARLLEQLGGQQLRYMGYRCEGEASEQGENRVWGPCLVRRLAAPGDTVEERLFGPIIERNGTFKLVSYANKS